MSELLSNLPLLFLNNLLPIFLAAGAGYLLARNFQLNPRVLSQVVFYVFSPCLIFTLLIQSKLSNEDILDTILSTGIFILLVGLITWLGGKALRLPRGEMAALLVTGMFMNAGNNKSPPQNSTICCCPSSKTTHLPWEAGAGTSKSNLLCSLKQLRLSLYFSVTFRRT